VSDDTIFREVEEEVRKEHYEQLWKAYGNYIIAGAAAIVLGAAGWQAWQTYQATQRQESSTRFEAALDRAEMGDLAGAETEFRAMTTDAAAGYRSLAKFRLAETQLAQNKRDEAIATLRDLTQDSDPLLASAARMRVAWMIADTAPRAEVEALIEPLAGENNPWRFNATELRAYLDLQGGNRDQAQVMYERLSMEPEAPQGMRQRATQIAQFLRANPTGAPTSPGIIVPPVTAPAAPAAPASPPSAPQEAPPQ
jgi:hypothetical protein